MECMVRRWGLTPLGGIGVVLNLLAVWAWTTEREFNPLIFFLKWLAVFDIFFLILYTAKSFALNSKFLNIRMAFLNMAVFTTTCASVYEYCSIFHPDIARKCVYKRAVLSIAAYFVLSVIFILFYLAFSTVNNHRQWLATEGIVFLLIPTILQVFLVARVMWDMLQNNKLSRRVPDTYLLQTTDKSGSQSPVQDATKAARMNRRQLTLALCHIILWSFIAFGIVNFIAVVLSLYPKEEEKAAWRVFHLATMFVLYIISSVSFVILYLFVSDFRNLIRKRINSSVRSSSRYTTT
jgi:hypothetical protein